MKRVLVGFCLSLVLILLDGYDQLYAYAPSSGIFGTVENYEMPGIRIGMPKAHGQHKLENLAIEEEDDQFNSFKKYLQSRCQFAALFLAQALKDLLHDSVNGATFFDLSSYASVHRSHVVLQVFRI